MKASAASCCAGVLRAKFAPLPADAERRVVAADEATLERWIDAVLTAQELIDQDLTMSTALDPALRDSLQPRCIPRPGS